MITKEAKKLAKILWDYHRMNQPLKKVDYIFAMGSHDLRVAERAAELHSEEWAPKIIFSGGFGYITKNIWKKPEAEKFAEVAIEMGVPEKDILVENKASNTGENIALTKELLKKKGLVVDSIIVVQKPYMERRTHAIFKKQWPEVKVIVTSPQISFEGYPNKEVPFERFINIMVGDLQRIKVYPEKGFQVSQKIPKKVWSAYERLVELGYDKFVIKE